MRTNKGDGIFGGVLVAILLVYIGGSTRVLGAETAGSENVSADAKYEDFRKAVEAGNDTVAESIAGGIFEAITLKYKSDRGFATLESRLKVAEFLSQQMKSQLNKAKLKKIASVANELFGDAGKHVKDISLMIAPAKSFYETSEGVFSQPVVISKLTEKEKGFLGQYYDLKLRLMTTAVAQAGQALAVAEPDFKGTHKYVLVLPLLHVTDGDSVNVDVFPRWMRGPGQLDIFSDSCLLDFGFPFHAMSLAKRAAQMRNERFSESNFYRSASKKCEVTDCHAAVDCLNMAIDCVRNKEPEKVVELEFDIVGLWLDSQNYRLAASKAKEIMDTYPRHSDAERAIWLYYYSLSRSGNADEILANIDTVVDDKRVESFRARLLYVKWWALRRRYNQTARLAALEYELLQRYSDDPMIAPVLLSRATDLLSRQNYNNAHTLLSQLAEKFPSTDAAKQASRIITKIKDMGNIR